MSKKLQDEILDQLRRLPVKAQREVLEFARSQPGGPPKGMSGKEFVRQFAGMLSKEEGEKMARDIMDARCAAPIPPGVPGREFAKAAGMFSRQEAEQMIRDIEEACENVDQHGW